MSLLEQLHQDIHYLPIIYERRSGLPLPLKMVVPRPHFLMDVTLDGIIYQLQSQGGISHIFDEILPRMCDEDDALSIDLLISGKCRKAIPIHPHINTLNLFPIDDVLCPTRLWGTTRFPIRAYSTILDIS